MAMGLSGCCSGVHPETISTAKIAWQGKVGRAATITQSRGTKELEGVKSVSFKLCGWRSGSGFWEPAWMPTDYTVPVLQLESHAVTVFFSTDYDDTKVLEYLPTEFRAGKVRFSGCHPDRIC